MIALFAALESDCFGAQLDLTNGHLIIKIDCGQNLTHTLAFFEYKTKRGICIRLGQNIIFGFSEGMNNGQSRS